MGLSTDASTAEVREYLTDKMNEMYGGDTIEESNRRAHVAEEWRAECYGEQ